MNRKTLAVAALLPTLVACEEVEVPFLVPVSIDLPAVEQEDSPDGLYRLVEATEPMSLDDVRAEVPERFRGIQDLTITAMSITDPEFDDITDPEFDDITDPEFDDMQPEALALADFADRVRVYISTDMELSDDDRLLASIEAFDPSQTHHEATITENAELSRYEEGTFSLIVQAWFTEMPPGEMSLPLTVSGYGTADASQMILGQ